ncbi:acyltransferase [Burkholderia multivorans]|uniref:acyltransferase family protein n=1 Tax=Burkholderia multivorans TaxID=87883 RepID=UPI001B924CA6|nr:acyltransferase family protein [Burkholderia multivorans]MBR8122262.1 acyltransferase [Burkholderia multivorans]MBU9599908.1 acyltransferase [Burkholderia multivorans]
MEKKPFHANYIDGLRAIAVLSVVIYHLNGSWLPGGFAGVDVFFVISGFVVAMSVSELGPLDLHRFLAYFYARRLVRITPALVVMLLATFFASALFIPEAWLSSSNQKTGLFAFLGLSNFVLSFNSGNYFSPIAEFNPFTHTWSLAVEEQFYLLFPWMFVPWLRGKRIQSIGLFLIAVGASIACSMWLGRTDETTAFYMMWSRFWELGAGVLLFQFMHARGHSFNSASPSNKVFSILADLGLLTLIAGLVLARPAAAPFPACVLPVVGTAVVLGILHGRRGGIAYALLTCKPLRFIGAISYSLYLWHWPVFVLFRWTTGLESHNQQLVALLLTAVFSVLSYRFVEQPPRRMARVAPKAGMIAAGLGLVASGYLASAAIAANQPAISLSTVTRHMDLWYPEGPSVVRTANGCSVAASSRGFDGGMVFIYERSGCEAVPTFAHSVFVLGDSHAMAYTGMLKQFVALSGAAVYAYNVGGCPFISLQPRIPGRDDTCKKFGDAAIADVMSKIKQGDVVFLASLRLPRMVDQWAVFGVESAKSNMFSRSAQEGRDRAVQDAIPILSELAQRGARIIFEAPTPMLESIPYRCSDPFNRNNPICAKGMSVSKSLLEDLRAPILDSYDRMAREVPNISVWDPMPILCPDGECHAFRDGKPLLFDGDHLSYFSNMLLLPSFSAFLDERMPREKELAAGLH